VRDREARDAHVVSIAKRLSTCTEESEQVRLIDMLTTISNGYPSWADLSSTDLDFGVPPACFTLASDEGVLSSSSDIGAALASLDAQRSNISEDAAPEPFDPINSYMCLPASEGISLCQTPPLKRRPPSPATSPEESKRHCSSAWGAPIHSYASDAEASATTSSAALSPRSSRCSSPQSPSSPLALVLRPTRVTTREI